MTDREKRSVIGKAYDFVLAKSVSGTSGALFLILLGMGLVLGINIVLRFVFESPISWANVVTRYAYIYVVLLGTAVSYIEGSHAQIDFIYDSVPRSVQGIFDLIHVLSMIFLCILLLVYGTKHVMTMWPVHSPVVPWLSVGVVYLSVPLAAILMILFLVRKLTGIKFR